ncbi:MAG TPA: radical SAM protein [Kineosporiaceae bacterium]
MADLPAGAVAGSSTPAGSGLVAGTAPFSAVDGPGNRYVVFLQGCQWDCLACHNPCAIPRTPPAMRPTPVGEVVAGIRDAARFLTGVTVTGGEATLQAGFVQALFAELAEDPRTARLTRFVDSNGDCDPPVWERLAPVTDGVMLDLKCLDDELHVVLTGYSNARVLASARELAARGLLYEVRLLLVPGLNDGEGELVRTARWLLSVDPAVRVRVNAFRRQGTRPCARDLLEPTADDLARYRHVLCSAGLRRLTTPR